MSLLLDALKRAEEAKRAKSQDGQAAAADGGVIRALVTPVHEQLSLEDYPEIAAAPKPPVAAIPTAHVMDFSKDDPPAQPAQAPVSPLLAPARIPREATSTRPPARLVRQDFTLHPADTTAAEGAQREAARNVFAAKQNAAASQRGKWLLPLIAFLVVGLGAGGWYMWNEVKRISRNASSAQVTRPVSAPASSLPVASSTTGQASKASETPASKRIAQALPPLLPPPARDAPLPNRASSKIGSQPGRMLTERELLVNGLKDSGARPPRDAPIALKLSQTIDPPRVDPEVLAAYAALTRGDYAQARQRYQRAVQAEPSDLDAHLGLAVAAARMGENALAGRHYRRALDLDPRNSVALAGMLAVSTAASPEALEGELKRLVAKDANSAALQFSLGNLYASERRWTEAQQAYFEAYRLESENADYRYNLAVALDQLKQNKLALDYYQKALAQAAKTGGQFDLGAVQRRIAELKAS